MRQTRSEVIRARVTPGTKAEVVKLADRTKRSEADVVRLLVEEALAARAAKR